MTLSEFNTLANECNCRNMMPIIELMDDCEFEHTVVNSNEYASIMKKEFGKKLNYYYLNEFIEFVLNQINTCPDSYFMENPDEDDDQMYVCIRRTEYWDLISDLKSYLEDEELFDDEDPEDEEDTNDEDYNFRANFEVNDSGNKVQQGESYSTYKERKNEKKLSMLKRVESLI